VGKFNPTVDPFVSDAETEISSNGILARKKPFGGRFAKNDLALGLAAVQLKTSAQEQRNAKGLEIIRRYVGVADTARSLGVDFPASSEMAAVRRTSSMRALVI
jgi:hypothetical protein